jgi:hypothetical protein
MWYRICWKSPVNGEIQRDRPLFTSLEAARSVAILMNATWPDTLHWAEPVEEFAPSAAPDADPSDIYAQPRA